MRVHHDDPIPHAAGLWTGLSLTEPGPFFCSLLVRSNAAKVFCRVGGALSSGDDPLRGLSSDQSSPFLGAANDGVNM